MKQHQITYIKETVCLFLIIANTCAATVHVQISPTFFGWLAQFGNRMHVISPANVIKQYEEHIKTILTADIADATDKETK